MDSGAAVAAACALCGTPSELPCAACAGGDKSAAAACALWRHTGRAALCGVCGQWHNCGGTPLLGAPTCVLGRGAFAFMDLARPMLMLAQELHQTSGSFKFVV